MVDTSKTGDLVSFVKALHMKGTPEKDISKAVGRFLEHKARKERIPLIGTFELTPYCNLDCKMCYVHLSRDKAEDNRLLDVESWKNLIQQAYDAGMRQAKLTGGECLTYPGFEEIYLFLKEKKIRISLATNGVLLDKKHIQFFMQYPPNAIQVSLYGGSEDIYEAVTGHRCFEIVYKNLQELSKSTLPISIAITPNYYNVNSMNQIFEIADSLNIPYRINSLLLNPRNNTGRSLQDLSNEDYVQIFRTWNERKKNVLTPIDPEDLPLESKEGSSNVGIRCGAGRSAFTILYNGKMCPCVSLDELIATPIVDGFVQAWKQVVDLADNYQNPAECVDCVYRRTCLICPAAHKNSLKAGHCDTRICKQTKEYISAGIVPFLPA